MVCVCWVVAKSCLLARVCSISTPEAVPWRIGGVQQVGIEADIVADASGRESVR